MNGPGAMRDQSVTFTATTVTVGGTKVGPGTALIDEDVLRVLLLDSPTGEKALQFRYESIAGVGMSGEAVEVTMRDGRTLVVSLADASAFRSRMLSACRALPEVTRALRALGSRRGIGGVRRNPSNREAGFFAPLIAARRGSMEARDASSVIAAFDARGLAAEMSRVLIEMAADLSGGHPARRRALEAELGDAAEPLSVALTVLDEIAQAAARDVDDLGRWRAWADSLQRAFEAADRSWVEIERVVNR